MDSIKLKVFEMSLTSQSSSPSLRSRHRSVRTWTLVYMILPSKCLIWGHFPFAQRYDSSISQSIVFFLGFILGIMFIDVPGFDLGERVRRKEGSEREYQDKM